MRAPAFWALARPSPVARLLTPAAMVYGAIAGGRMARNGWRAAVPVICVGNFTLGGSGKTPAAIRIAEMLRDAGERPVFLSRGYGGRLTGPLRVDPARHGPRDVGDEALLLARAAPTVVSADRPAGARLAAAEGGSVVVMDDGLQNPSLHKDVAIAVVDGGAGLGNGLVFPAGPLRAPLAAQWPQADAVAIVGEGERGDIIARDADEFGKVVLRARLQPDADVAAKLNGRGVLAFCGIGRPKKFFRTLEECGALVKARREFPDHHPFTAGEIGTLCREATAAGLMAVTTEKDFVRIPGASSVARQSCEIIALPVRLVLQDDEGLRALVSGMLARGGCVDRRRSGS
jgi:tetraacyldisaccharide 4'-kinase